MVLQPVREQHLEGLLVSRLWCKVGLQQLECGSALPSEAFMYSKPVGIAMLVANGLTEHSVLGIHCRAGPAGSNTGLAGAQNDGGAIPSTSTQAGGAVGEFPPLAAHVHIPCSSACSLVATTQYVYSTHSRMDAAHKVVFGPCAFPTCM